MIEPSILSKGINRFSFFFLSFLLGCTSVSEEINPSVHYSVHEKMIQSLPSAFTPLTQNELEKTWATEYRMGLFFAKKLDLYRAVTSFQRAEFLLSEEPNPVLCMDRKHEVEYYTLLCYSLGKRHEDLVTTFESSSLAFVNPDFKAYKDLLLILGEAYDATKQKHKAFSVHQALAQNYPKSAQAVLIGSALQTADNKTALAILHQEKGEILTHEVSIQKALSQSMHPHHFLAYDQLEEHKTAKLKSVIEQTHTSYLAQKKSPFTAQMLGVIPGGGYAYLGQYQSAITAFSVNALFIGTAAYFFLNGNVPAGVLTTSFEAGWYFGSIYGAGQAAKTYNERLYEALVHPVMEEKKLYPLLQLEYGF